MEVHDWSIVKEEEECKICEWNLKDVRLESSMYYYFDCIRREWQRIRILRGARRVHRGFKEMPRWEPLHKKTVRNYWDFTPEKLKIYEFVSSSFINSLKQDFLLNEDFMTENYATKKCKMLIKSHCLYLYIYISNYIF